jgi:hypothetical protein
MRMKTRTIAKGDPSIKKEERFAVAISLDASLNPTPQNQKDCQALYLKLN